MKYQLPCSCGRSVPVELAQAGQPVRCACGADLEVPAMRLIRRLPVAEGVVSEKRRGDLRWSVTRGLLFALGLAVLVGGLGTAAYYQWWRSSLNTETQQRWDDLEEDQATIEKSKVNETWDGWKKLREDEIGPYVPPVFIIHRLFSQYWLKYVLGSLIVATVGLVLVLTALFARVGTKSSKPAARR